MIEAPLALAFSAGLVATVNPCGFAMLPAYLSYFVGTGEDGPETTAESLRRSLVVGGIVSAAFIGVFGVAGVLLSLGARFVTDAVPWLALAVGMGIVLLGVAMLTGRDVFVRLPKASRVSRGRRPLAIVGFGVSYAVASLSCTLPVFLSIVALQLRRTDLVSGIATFVAYGVGMSMLLVGVTIAIGLGRRGVVRLLRRSTRFVGRVSGAILVVSGVYIVWFWGTNLSQGAGALSSAGPFRFVESLSRRALDMVGGHPLLFGVGLGLVIVGAVTIVVQHERVGGDHDGESERLVDVRVE